MRRNERTSRYVLAVEPLEARALLSTGKVAFERYAIPRLAHVHQVQSSDNAAALGAIENAIEGGAGSEFVKLILSEVRNPLTLINRFSSSKPYQYSIPGIVAKTPNWQPAYIGLPHDTLSVTVGGGLLLKGKKIELGAIVRGPFTSYPNATTIVFAINRGAGRSLGPYFAGRPGITPDSLVTVTVGPNGKNNSASITDLTTGATQALTSPRISVAGPTVRILLDSSQLPSTKHWPVAKYTFSIWTATEPNAPFQDVGSFAPENSMIPIGVETNVRPTL
jgi:hypothetical protein